ncbi:MAG: hypothetical protein QOI57_2945 [Rubrobacteraceae bacterium]|nr:hypothetical protein [Rubrobacteraceae bacterium]
MTADLLLADADDLLQVTYLVSQYPYDCPKLVLVGGLTGHVRQSRTLAAAATERSLNNYTYPQDVVIKRTSLATELCRSRRAGSILMQDLGYGFPRIAPYRQPGE